MTMQLAFIATSLTFRHHWFDSVMASSNLMCSVHKSGNLQGCLSGQIFFWQFYYVWLYYLSLNETCDLNIMFSAFLCVSFRRTKAEQPYCIQISSADGLLSCRIPPDVITFIWEEQHAQYSIILSEAGKPYSTFHEIFTCMIYIQSMLDVPVRETNRTPLKHPSSLCNLFYTFMNIV